MGLLAAPSRFSTFADMDCMRRFMRIACAWSFACAAFLTPNRSDIASCIKGNWSESLVVQEKLIVDTKTIDRITDHERGQMLNYLRITTLPVGVILNFKHARLQWERLVLTRDRSNADERKSGEADFLLQPELST